MKKKLLTICMAFAFALSVSACTKNYTFEGGEITTKPVDELVYETTTVPEDEETPDETEIISESKMIIDRTGNSVFVPDSINTIVSAAPSITEILVGLGLGDKIIAADTWSYDVEGIDPAICTIDFSTLNIEALTALSPDVIIITEMSTAGAEDPYAQLKAAGVQVVYVPTSQSIQSIKEDIMFIAEYTKRSDIGANLVNEIDEVISEIMDKRALIDVAYTPKVYFEMNAAPYLYSCGSGTFIDEVITLCGGENIYKGEYGWLSNSEESVIAADPNIIFTSVQYDGYDFNEIMSRAGWDGITAIKENRVYQVDANAVSRPSQNIVKGIRQIAYAIYPGVFPDYEMA